MPSSKIPSRWEDYMPIGKPVSGTRFIAFKVPLKQSLCAKLPDSQHFTPEILLETQKTSSWKLGLIIDLTNTTRYYDPQVFTSCGIEYQKLFTEGKVVPSDEVKMKFLSVVDDFIKRNTEDEKLIGVHCTHGVNRTGHLVCRYMVDIMGFEPENAIKVYDEARGHKIERENYLADVKTCLTDMKKYESFKRDGCPSPPPPWKQNKSFFAGRGRSNYPRSAGWSLDESNHGAGQSFGRNDYWDNHGGGSRYGYEDVSSRDNRSFGGGVYGNKKYWNQGHSHSRDGDDWYREKDYNRTQDQRGRSRYNQRDSAYSHSNQNRYDRSYQNDRFNRRTYESSENNGRYQVYNRHPHEYREQKGCNTFETDTGANNYSTAECSNQDVPLN